MQIRSLVDLKGSYTSCATPQGVGNMLSRWLYDRSLPYILIYFHYSLGTFGDALNSETIHESLMQLKHATTNLEADYCRSSTLRAEL
jgi:hypothetical protein